METPLRELATRFETGVTPSVGLTNGPTGKPVALIRRYLTYSSSRFAGNYPRERDALIYQRIWYRRSSGSGCAWQQQTQALHIEQFIKSPLESATIIVRNIDCILISYDRI